jgi:hypothetical protein
MAEEEDGEGGWHSGDEEQKDIVVEICGDEWLCM